MVSLRECISHIPLPSANKTANFGFETQRRHYRGISGPTKGLMSSNFFFKKTIHLDLFAFTASSIGFFSKSFNLPKFIPICNSNHKQDRFLKFRNIPICSLDFMFEESCMVFNRSARFTLEDKVHKCN